MEHIGKAEAKEIRQYVEGALDSVRSELGVAIELGNARYDPEVGTWKTKLTVSMPGAADRKFEKDARRLGLEPSDLGKEFESNGRRFRITGVKPRNRRYPLLAEEVETGKKFKFPVAAYKPDAELDKLKRLLGPVR